MSFFGFDTALPRDKNAKKTTNPVSLDDESGLGSRIDELMESKYAYGLEGVGDEEEAFEDIIDADDDDLNDATFGDSSIPLETDFDFGRNAEILQAAKPKEILPADSYVAHKPASFQQQAPIAFANQQPSHQAIQPQAFPSSYPPSGIPQQGLTLQQIEAQLRQQAAQRPPMGLQGPPMGFHPAFPPSQRPPFHGFPANMMPPLGMQPGMNLPPHIQPGMGMLPPRPITAEEIEAMMRQQMMARQQQQQMPPSVNPAVHATTGPHNLQELETAMKSRLLVSQNGPGQMTEQRQQPAVLQSSDFPPLGKDGNEERRQDEGLREQASSQRANRNNQGDGNRSYQNRQRQNQQQRQDHRGGRRDQQQAYPLLSQEILDVLEGMDEMERIRAREANMTREERYKGLMREREKNLVAKIQISQLVTADPYADDFYYQIFTALKGEDQTMNDQYDRRNRRNRTGKGNSYNVSNFMQQQLKKSIEERKLKPKEGTLSLEGALGKISSTSIRNPKKAIQIASFSSVAEVKTSASMSDRESIETPLSSKAVLRAVENVYSAVLHLEQLNRKIPEDPTQRQKWERRFQKHIQTMWNALHVTTNVPMNVTHPTASFLNFSKGVSVLPRALGFFRPDQIYAIYQVLLTRLECLDVMNITCGTVSEKVDNFMTHVIPPMVTLLGDASLTTVNSMTKILLERHNLVWMAKSRIGLSILTILLSRAEILKQGTPLPDEKDLGAWGEMYAFMFQSMQGSFASLFPPAESPAQDDVYVWQFLSALAVGSGSVNYQLTLVSEVRENAIAASKSGDPKAIDNINLFLNALGLQIDATQLAATLA